LTDALQRGSRPIGASYNINELSIKLVSLKSKTQRAYLALSRAGWTYASMKRVEFVHDSIKKQNHTYAMIWSVLDGVGALADLASNLIMMKTMQPRQLRGKVAQSFSNIDCDLYASIKA